MIQRELQNPLAEMILKGGIADGDAVKVSATGNDKLAITAARAPNARRPPGRRSRAGGFIDSHDPPES